MPGLKDIGKKLRRTVRIADEDITVRGLTAAELASLLGEYPELGKLMGGNFDRIDADALQHQAPDCVAQMIAIGVSVNGHAPEAADIDDARGLPGVAALDLLAAIAELSLPRAVVRPFVQMVTDGDAEPYGDIGRGPDTK